MLYRDHPKTLALALTAYLPSGLIGPPIAGWIVGAGTNYIGAFAFAGSCILGAMLPVLVIIYLDMFVLRAVVRLFM